MYEQAALLFSRYRASATDQLPSAADEVERRLRQLDFLLDRYREVAATIAEGAGRADETAVETAHTYAECFYLLAWRLRQVFTKNTFPGLGRFDVPGVTNVRSRLIEHPGTQPAGQPYNFACGTDALLLVDPALDASDPPWTDPGLWANATEYRDAIERLFADATRP